MADSLETVTQKLREFAAERDWEQFHDPKNLAMAVVSEAGELAAEYRWVPNSEADDWTKDADNLARVMAEAADVGIALLMFCDRVWIDLVDAMRHKIEVNRRNYPADKARGHFERPTRQPPGTGRSESDD